MKIFSFSTSPGSEQFPGKLACENQGIMGRVYSKENVFHQMLPYFTYLESTSGANSVIITAPYLDVSGLGLMVTAAMPVYSDISGQ